MDVYGRIYKITCMSNNKIYIGQTTRSIAHRWRKHQDEATYEGRGNRRNGYIGPFHKALNDIGYRNFIIEEVCVAYSKEELDRLEEYHIKNLESYNPDKGYNRQIGRKKIKYGGVT